MIIQKGVVKDQGFPDVECTYGTMDDGKVYYFIPGGKLGNGNTIVSSNLKEAIGHANHTSLGVIKPDGSVVLECVYARIIPLTKKILFVERNRAETSEVIGALSQNEDVNKKELLNTNKETIKNKLITKMGANGKLLFANQFSEASITDIDGNFLMGDKWYSFIGNNGTKLYFSTNLLDSDIDLYDFDNNKEIKEEDITVNKEEEIPTSDTKPIEVNIPSSVEIDNTNISNSVEDTYDVDKANELRRQEEELEEERKRIEREKEELEELKRKENKKYEKDSIIEDVRVTMKKLISQNVKQKNIIIEKEAEIEILTEKKEELTTDNKAKEERIESLEEEKDNLLNNKKDLEEERDSLKETLEEKNKLIDNYERELEVLRPQIVGKEELPNLIKEAIEVLDDDKIELDINSDQKEEVKTKEENEEMDISKYLDEDVFQKVKVA